MDSKNIKDYLHLYMGCEVDTTVKGNYIHPYGSVNIEAVDDDSYENLIRHLKLKESYQKDGFIDYDWVSVKLILRPLSDMTDEEMDEVWHGIEPKNVLVMEYKNSGIERKVALCSERTRYLLSKGFDLFNLIESGLAIKKSS